MNALLTCAGRRSWLVAAFKEAGCRVLACDSSLDAPALHGADAAFATPPVSAENYTDALLALCEEHKAGLLVPALEPELPLLAANKKRFAEAGALALVSSPEIVEICYDKLASARFLTGLGIAAPASYLSPEAALEAGTRFPMIIKPRRGVSSTGIEFAENAEELRLACGLLKMRTGDDILIQERLRGTEYGLDIVNDMEGRHVCTFAKRKLRMHAGQTDRAVTVKDEGLENLGRIIGENLNHVGMLDCDLFVTEAGCTVIDLNPRMGGGYPYAHAAGANFPAALAAWAGGQTPRPEWFKMKPGVKTARADLYVQLSE